MEDIAASNEISMLADLYEFTMGSSYLENDKDVVATFDLFIRRLPEKRSYLIAMGVSDAIKE